MLLDARELSRVRTPLLLAAAMAWSVLLMEAGGVSVAAHCGITSGPGAAPASASLQMLLAMNPPGSLAAGWMLMLIAMMAPLLILPLHHVSVRSLARRRSRAIALFTAAYAAVWFAAGACLIPMALAIAMLVPQASLPAVALLAALLWQCSPVKQRCLNRCHAHPALAAFGRAADLDALRFGAWHGIWCVGSCWALMLVPVLLPRGHLVAMAAATVLVCVERLERPRLPSWRVRGLGKAARIVAWRARATAG